MVRDLINTPAYDMSPRHLEEEVRLVENAHKAKFQSISGDRLLHENFPLIYAVGKAGETPLAF